MRKKNFSTIEIRTESNDFSDKRSQNFKKLEFRRCSENKRELTERNKCRQPEMSNTRCRMKEHKS